MIEIRPLDHSPLSQITACFNEAFSDYILKFSMTEEQLRQRWRGARVDYSLSFGAFEEDQLVGFIMTGIDEYLGKKSAFNMATGVIPTFRGQRLVKQLYERAIPEFRQQGIRQGVLEVLSENETAIRAYQSVGFELGRKLHCFSGPLETVDLKLPAHLEFRQATRPNWEKYRPLQDFLPTWEHENQAIDLLADQYVCWELYETEKLQAYFISRSGGFMPQLAVAAGRWVDLGPLLMNQMAQCFGKTTINNVPSERAELLKLLKHQGVPNFIDQYEMILSISEQKLS